MKRYKVKNPASRRDSKEIPVFLKKTGKKLENNPNFPAPIHSPAALVQQADKIRDIEAEVETKKAELKELSESLRQQRSEGYEMLRENGLYVDLMSDGDAEKIYSGGYDPQQMPSTTKALPDPPQKVTLTEANGAGKLKVQCKRVDGASYKVWGNYDITDDSGWVELTSGFKSSYILTGLNSGERLWVRMTLMTTAGESSPSNIDMRIVP